MYDTLPVLPGMVLESYAMICMFRGSVHQIYLSQSFSDQSLGDLKKAKEVHLFRSRKSLLQNIRIILLERAESAVKTQILITRH